MTKNELMDKMAVAWKLCQNSEYTFEKAALQTTGLGVNDLLYKLWIKGIEQPTLSPANAKLVRALEKIKDIVQGNVIGGEDYFGDEFEEIERTVNQVLSALPAKQTGEGM
jgi:hypothetical protein